MAKNYPDEKTDRQSVFKWGPSFFRDISITMPCSILIALASAALFGLSTPLARMRLDDVPPVALTGLPYLGSGNRTSGATASLPLDLERVFTALPVRFVFTRMSTGASRSAVRPSPLVTLRTKGSDRLQAPEGAQSPDAPSGERTPERHESTFLRQRRNP